jgi:3-hydroxyisobutyrate dehydrogenase
MSSPSIGFVGVGRMGANMARRLHELSHPIAALYDLDAETARALATELGTEAVDTPSAVTASAGIVFTVVSDDAAMRSLFRPGPGGLLDGAAGRLFINCATVSPGVHLEVAEACAAVGARSLEACMASSIPQARQGTLYLMIGGEKADYERVRPLLADLSKELQYIGPSGSAAQVKALVNMVMNINTAGLAEGLGLGAALGLDLAVLKRVFSQTGANSRVLETDGDDMIQREHDCYFSAAHAAKDSAIANALAASRGVEVPLSQATEAQYRRLIAEGKGGLDKSGVAELTFPGRS